MRFGYGFHAVRVTPGVTLAGGEFGGAYHCRWDTVRRKPRDYVFRRVVALYAASYAQARYAGCHVNSCLFNDGAYDLAEARRFIARCGKPDRLKRAVRREVKRFVADAVMWEAINALADLLLMRGRVEAGEPDVLAITSRIKRWPS